MIQWEPAQSDIDRYRLTVTPSDGAGTSQEVTVPPDQSSTHIQQLEAGRLYDVVLVAEKGPSRSGPAAAQVTPGEEEFSEYFFLRKLAMFQCSPCSDGLRPPKTYTHVDLGIQLTSDSLFSRHSSLPHYCGDIITLNSLAHFLCVFREDPPIGYCGSVLQASRIITWKRGSWHKQRD